MAQFKWDLERRRDPRTDPNLGLMADQSKLAFIERYRSRPMTVSLKAMREDPDGARDQADHIQARLDYDLELWRWATEALPAAKRQVVLREAQRAHRECSGWLSILTGEAFSVDPPGRHRIGT